MATGLSTHILPFVSIYLLSAAVTFALAIYVVFRGENDRALQSFGILLVGIILWAAAEAAQLVTASLGDKIIWHWVGYVGVVATPPAFLVFVLYYTGRNRLISIPSLVLLAVEPVLVLVLVVTNGGHKLYYESVTNVLVGTSPVLTTTAGPGFWLHTAYSYILIGLAVLLLIRFALTTERLYRFQTVTLVSGSLIPLLANVAFLMGISPNAAFDLTPLSFALSALLIFVGIAYSEFAHVLPVTRDAVLNTLEDGILVVDGEDCVLYINPAAKQIIGETSTSEDPDHLIGEPLTAVLPVVPAAEDSPVVESTPEMGFEASIRRDGESRWFWLRRRKLEAGGAGSTVLTVTDITDRKHRQRKATRLQRLTWTLMSAEGEAAVATSTVEAAASVFSLPVSVVFLVQKDGRQLEPVAVAEDAASQPGAARSYGRDEADRLGELLWRAHSTGDSMVHENVRESASLAGCDLRLGSVILHPLGNQGVLLAGARTPQSFDRADLALLDIMASTVTVALDQAAKERELRDNQRRLRQQNERLEEFTSVVSHDLRSPLNTATGYVDLLQRDIEDSKLDRVADATARMKTLIDDLLTLSRQGRTVDEPTPVPLTEVVDAAWESVPTPGLALSVVDDLGPVPADESRLQQALENLFRNASDHATSASKLRVGRLDDGFYVSDDGPGIPQDQREDVFEHGYSTGDEGTGLGLAILKRIVEAHGWRVDLRASREGGARFEVRGIDSFRQAESDVAAAED
jgi:PAS domain S-box-containing protein